MIKCSQLLYFIPFNATDIGIGVINLGHSHPAVTESVTAACENLVHAQQNIMRHRPMVDLIDRLSSLEVSKKANLDSWFLWNSGAEAVEAAIKLARQVVPFLTSLLLC